MSHEMNAHLRAGRLAQAHDLVQRDDSTTAAWLRGIVHIQKRDLEDAEYWYDRAGRQSMLSRGPVREFV